MWEWRTRIPIIFLVLVILSIPKASQAALDHVLITEVQITGGTGATDHDFVEIFNPTNQPVDLNGYRLVKRTANGTTDTTLKSWISSTSIPANGYFLWANSAFQKDGVVPDETNSGTLSDNNSVALRLGEANAGAIIDSLGWGSATGVFIQGSAFPTNPGAKQSLERKAGSDTNDNAQDFFLQSSPNPMSTKNVQGDQPVVSGSSNDSAPVSAPTGLFINEVFPAPSSGGNEWIELFNNSSVPIDLSGGTLEDGAGTVAQLSGSLAPGAYLAVDLASAKLNNDGDLVRLIFSGTVVDQVSYGKWNDGTIDNNAAAPKSNQSVARKISATDTNIDSADFAVTEEVTKGALNIIVFTQVVRTSSSSSKLIRTIPPAVIVINELVSDPGDNDVEWVELYNAGEVSVDVSLWTVEDGSGTLVKLSGTFLPRKFMVISPIPGVLNNTGDVIVVRNEKGEIADRVAYGVWDDGNRTDNALLTRDPQSLGRRSDGYDTGKDNKDFVALSPSKGASNALGLAPDVVSVPDGAILISEIKPGADSFVELFNTTESYLRLSGWSLTVGPGDPVEIDDALIAPRGFFAIAFKEKIDMSRGSVVLVDTKEHQKDKVSYRDGKTKLAYALIDNGWVWVEPTPEKQNVITIQTETVSLAAVAPIAPAKPKSTSRTTGATTMRGVVVAAPGAITKTSFYVSGKQNMQIYIPNGNVKVKEGDEVVVYGKLGTSSGEPRFTVRDNKDITVVKSGVGVAPQEIEVQDLSDADAAKLVKISGTISDKQGTTVYLDDGSGEVRVSLSSLSRAKDPVSLTQGSAVTVVGIVRASSSGIRIVPRSAADVVVNIPQEIVVPSKTQELVSKEKPDHTRAYLFATAAAFGGLVIVLVLKGQIVPDRLWETVRKRFKPKPEEPVL